MKITIEVDCTPAEARAFMGLQQLLKNWAPWSAQGMETFQNFAKAAAGSWSQAGSGSGKDRDPEPPKSKPRG